MRNSLYLLLFTAATGLFSCQKKLDKATILSNPDETAGTSVVVPCVTPDHVSFVNHYGTTFGEVVVSNDGDNVIFNVSSSNSNYTISAIKMTYGDWDHVSDALDGVDTECGGPSPADLSQNYSAPGNLSEEVTVPLGDVGSCFYYQVHVTLVRRDLAGNIVETKCVWTTGNDYVTSYSWSQFREYCVQVPCPPPPPPPPPGDCGQLRSQTMGGWGAAPSGDNPGTYLHANFGTAFPGGVQVGCGSNTITLTSAQAITDLLPASVKSVTISGAQVNTLSVKNTLVGQLVALTLNVGFDAHDADFGEAGMQLGSMIIGGSGAFAGKTVNEFLDIANDVLGGCSSAFTINQVNEMATLINENYTDGLIDNKVLICPEENINY